MKFLESLFLVMLLAVGSFAQPAANGSSASARLPMPSAIADSLPWFAVREVSTANAPFTKTHLTQLAQANKRVALVYFATWCIPCREGVKRLAKAKDLLAQNKVGVVLVNIGENDEKLIEKWVEKLGASDFKIIVDPFKRMTENFGIVGAGEEMALPKTLVVDSQVKPVILIGQEGKDWPQILWAK